MLIAVISDIHDNLAYLKIFLDWSKNNKIKKIICCGDVTNLDTVKYLSTNFSGEIFLISSTRELFQNKDLKKYNNVTHCGEIGLIEIDGINIGFCHEPRQIEKIIKKSLKNLNYIFYGHTHKPWIEHKNNCFLVNPGNIAGIYYSATFSLLNSTNKKISLKLLNNL